MARNVHPVAERIEAGPVSCARRAAPARPGAAPAVHAAVRAALAPDVPARVPRHGDRRAQFGACRRMEHVFDSDTQRGPDRAAAPDAAAPPRMAAPASAQQAHRQSRRGVPPDRAPRPRRARARPAASDCRRSHRHRLPSRQIGERRFIEIVFARVDGLVEQCARKVVRAQRFRQRGRPRDAHARRPRRCRRWRRATIAGASGRRAAGCTVSAVLAISRLNA